MELSEPRCNGSIPSQTTCGNRPPRLLGSRAEVEALNGDLDVSIPRTTSAHAMFVPLLRAVFFPRAARVAFAQDLPFRVSVQKIEFPPSCPERALAHEYTSRVFPKMHMHTDTLELSEALVSVPQSRVRFHAALLDPKDGSVAIGLSMRISGPLKEKCKNKNTRKTRG